MSKFKLNALLEITLAINENYPIEDLLKKYEKFLLKDLEIGKAIIISKGKDWECILDAGFGKEIGDELCGNKELFEVEEICRIGVDTPVFPGGGDYIIPVFNNDDPIAYVIIGDLEEGEGISPVVKHLRFIQTLSNIIVVAIENIRLYKENLKQVAIQREMELASRMQNMLIPSDDLLPSNEKIHFTAFYHPHYEVGGDYYDVVQLSDSDIGFCIADVSGKGISAAILMSNFQANLRALFSDEISLNELVGKLNQRVMNSAKGEKFITLFIARYNTDRNELIYVNAGHNPPLLYKKESAELIKLKSGCVGMGMLDDLPFVHEEKILVDSPMKILTYTDGLVELISEDDVEFGTKFIESKLSNSAKLDENIHDIISELQIKEENPAIFDDISILGVELYGWS